MIHITDKSKCCGCNACVQRCPKQCITMHEDEEGFLYPRVDDFICIDCGLCEKICPIINQNEPRKPLHIYAAKNNNENQRLQSSSGGIFILLAEQTIKQGGVVFGARFDNNWEVEHCYAETLEELAPLMRSKYVQSRIGNTYNEAEQFLKQGRQVLFVGTSCQIAALHKYLRKDYDNLLAVDFICHGVPSPKVWRKYLEEIRTERNMAAGKKSVVSSSIKTMLEISDINFRAKQLEGYSWKKSGFVVQKSSVGIQNSVLLSSSLHEDIYMKAFLNNLILRPSCYSCVAKSGCSMSDITMADFWGIGNRHPDLDDDKGVGLVMVHSDKGVVGIDALTEKISLVPMSFCDAVENNTSFYKPVAIPPKRSIFWEDFQKNSSVIHATSISMRQTWKGKIKRKALFFISKLYHTLFKK